MAVAGAIFAATSPALAQDLCVGFGPQTPRDISNAAGTNLSATASAPAASAMNLCNIHFHASAEHKSPSFQTASTDASKPGFRCEGSDSLTAAELASVEGNGAAACQGIAAGDTLEVHWVYTSCDVQPGEGLGACSSEMCVNPTLRVETQVFLAVNDPNAADFTAFGYKGSDDGARPQPAALPEGTGTPVVFAGSTTGPAYTEAQCSPLNVTWSVRPQCAKVDINSLNTWCGDNVFNEDHAHGVRALVTAPELLSPIAN
ncbi:delta-class carbonic anhydrase [Acuticoccus sp. MNP-M23]|uniref:delta-class carbonic anhydrase n=1 Tax=Acuticoccus sp. MNP-M23 TaxID=3072793 RepID=UPI00281551A2|nr:delta-class carbonic anhydrase [Acuticoccus sp. MNP-M23]WMS43332.1 delta-class carbonic anhydrase [Acuticoccus sp. MNP-M23]